MSLGYVIITSVLTPSYHNLHARMGAIFMALNSCVHYGYLSQRITIPGTGSFKKKRRNDDYENNYHLLFLTV